MITTTAMEKKLGSLLLIGTLLATAIVLFGGVWYLVQNGATSVDFHLLQNVPLISTVSVWQSALSFSPLGIVQFGLLVLVATQIMRVSVLFIFYLLQRNVWFSMFCGFVLVMLIYSLFS